MGHATSGGLAYKRHAKQDIGRSALQDYMKIFGELVNLLGYARSHNIFNFLSYKTNQDVNNRSVTIPPRLYKAGRDPPHFHLIIRNTTHRKTQDIGYYTKSAA